MRRYKVTFEIEVKAITPAAAKLKGREQIHAASVTVASLDDNHTSRFDPQATETLR